MFYFLCTKQTATYGNYNNAIGFYYTKIVFYVISVCF